MPIASLMSVPSCACELFSCAICWARLWFNNVAKWNIFARYVFSLLRCSLAASSKSWISLRILLSEAAHAKSARWLPTMDYKSVKSTASSARRCDFTLWKENSFGDSTKISSATKSLCAILSKRYCIILLFIDWYTLIAYYESVKISALRRIYLIGSAIYNNTCLNITTRCRLRTWYMPSGHTIKQVWFHSHRINLGCLGLNLNITINLILCNRPTTMSKIHLCRIITSSVSIKPQMPWVNFNWQIFKQRPNAQEKDLKNLKIWKLMCKRMVYQGWCT